MTIEKPKQTFASPRPIASTMQLSLGWLARARARSSAATRMPAGSHADPEHKLHSET